MNGIRNTSQLVLQRLKQSSRVDANSNFIDQDNSVKHWLKIVRWRARRMLTAARWGSRKLAATAQGAQKIGAARPDRQWLETPHPRPTTTKKAPDRKTPNGNVPHATLGGATREGKASVTGRAAFRTASGPRSTRPIGGTLPSWEFFCAT